MNSDDDHGLKLENGSKSSSAADAVYQNTAAAYENETNYRLSTGDVCDVYYKSSTVNNKMKPHVYDALEPGVGAGGQHYTDVHVPANVYTLAEPIENDLVVHENDIYDS